MSNLPEQEPPANARELELARVVAEFQDLQAGDTPANVEEFWGRYPHLGDELREQLEALVELEQMTLPDTSPPPAPVPEPLPERLSGHKILGEIGAGAMGRVLLAHDEGLGRRVAIKTLSPRYRDDAQVRLRFMQEARALAKLSHPNIVRIYNLGQAEEEPHFVMEYIEGAPLGETAKALTIEQRAELMLKVARAVDFLQEHHILHRDLKPGNILVGADLEPRLLDFGLALQVAPAAGRITHPGEIMGTPNYFSPEHTGSAGALDARSDVFCLGTIFYEMLTGALPFRGETLGEQMRSIRESDPVVPRRLNPAIPGELQDICLKAMEKKPADRYQTAREMADDLERFLAGEPVLAAPKVYASMMAGKIAQHLRELEGWRQDRILSDHEYDSLRKHYSRLSEPEDAWILQVRRLSLAQVSLYLGAWLLVVGAALLFLFEFRELRGVLPVAIAAAATVPTLLYGLNLWKRGRKRAGVAFLLAFCLLLPVTLLVTMVAYEIQTAPTDGEASLEIFNDLPEGYNQPTNAQMWWSLLLSLPAYLWLRRRTGSSVFSLCLAVMGALLVPVTLARQGALDMEFGEVAFLVMPYAGLFFVAAFGIERRGYPDDSRYFYPAALLFTFWAFSGMAADYKPLQDWLQKAAPWTRGQVEYFFILNAGIYYALHSLSERFRTSQMRMVAKTFRFVVPGHVLTSMFLLGIHATAQWEENPDDSGLHFEARLFEVLLPMVAGAFFFGSIPRQMKNYLVTGAVFLAAGIVRLQRNFFWQHSEWPLLLLAAGILVMLAATRYSPLKVMLMRMFRRR
jgi:serine/threonine-protein kinase